MFLIFSSDSMLPIYIPHRSEQSLNLIFTSLNSPFNSKPSRRQTGDRCCLKYQRVVTAISLKCVQFYNQFHNELHLKKAAIKKTLLIFPLSRAHRNKNRVGFIARNLVGVGKREKKNGCSLRPHNLQLHVLKFFTFMLQFSVENCCQKKQYSAR